MTNPNHQIKHARLSQFAFHLYEGLGQNSSYEIFMQDLHLSPEHLETIQLELQAIAAKSHLSHPGLQPLLPNEDRCTIALNNKQEFTPFLLNDAIILDITTQCHDRSISSLRKQIYHLHPSIGQCFFIYIQSDHSNIQLAKTYAQELGINGLFLKDEAKLLGSSIWEFSDGNFSYYIWIADNAATIEKEAEVDYYQHLLDLLCCRAKIEYVSHESRKIYNSGIDYYNEIEERLQQISKLDDDIEGRIKLKIPTLPLKIKKELDVQSSLRSQLQSKNDLSCKKIIREEQAYRIESLEGHLKFLPQRSYELAKCERDITTHLLTLKTNIKNARMALRYLLKPHDTFLQDFLHKDCVSFSNQIALDLQVLTPGQRFADQFIASIRGIVELDSQKQQLELEQEEKEREQRLQQTLTILGTGLTISGLASQTLPDPIEKLFPSFKVDEHDAIAKVGLWIASIGIHAVIGLITAFLVAWLLSICPKKN